VRYICGLDLGQANDWTAAVVVEQTEIEGAPPTARFRYDIRHVDRVRRVPYDAIAVRVRDLVERLGAAVLVVDATGVGRPVVDMLERFRIRAEIVAVTIGGGDAPVQHGSAWTCPKRDLATTVAVLLQTSRLHIGPQVPHAETLMKELGNFHVKVSASGHDTYEAWRSADKDDLVLAVALACWYGERSGPPASMAQVGFGTADTSSWSDSSAWGSPPSGRRREPWA
jgi:hypothetical protein